MMKNKKAIFGFKIGFYFILLILSFISITIFRPEWIDLPLALLIGLVAGIAFAFLNSKFFVTYFLTIYIIVEGLNVWIMGRVAFLPEFNQTFSVFWYTFTVSTLVLHSLRVSKIIPI